MGFFEQQPAPRNQTYALGLTTGYVSPATRLTQTTFTQWAFTRWRRAFWIDSDPGAIQYNWNPQYLVQTGAYPAWDVNYLPNSWVVNENILLCLQYYNYPARLTIPGFDDPNHGGIVNYDEAIDGTGDSNNGSWIGLFPMGYRLSSDWRPSAAAADDRQCRPGRTLPHVVPRSGP